VPYIKAKLDEWYEQLSESVTSQHRANVSVCSLLIHYLSFCHVNLHYTVSRHCTYIVKHSTNYLCVIVTYSVSKIFLQNAGRYISPVL